VPALRRGDGPREVHEPLVDVLPEMSAPSSRLNNHMTELWVERTGTRRYTGHSSRGAEVLIGSEDVDGVFTPGELLKIALAACSGMSSDQPLARRLGDDYQATVVVSGPADREQERYPHLEETLQVDLSGLSEADADRLRIVVNRAIDQVCTVGRTLKSGTEISFSIADNRQ
jgi:uncharacterized OsmC-like protein